MKRRSFLQTAGAASAATLLGPLAGSETHASTENGDPAMFLDRNRLRHRNQNRSTVVCQNGIVCASQPLAAVAGLDILKAGGNAIDAAVCTNAMLGVVEPMSCGPGGDLFAIAWIEKDRKLYGLNASGRSPYDWDLEKAAEMGLESIPAYEPLAWSVPGCVSGWVALLERFGTRNLGQVLEPAIHYAREGFPVSPIIASGWSCNPKRFPTLAETFLPDGKPLRFGDISKNPQVADFFQILAKNGADAFYKGEVAERIVKFSQDNGGRFSMKDFEDHEATWVEPATSSYRGYDVWEIPPNGQGIAVLQILNILENFDIASLNPESPEYLHLFIEAKKLAYEDRATYYADMDFADVPLEWLISKEYAKKRSASIDPKKASNQVRPGTIPDESNTVYLAAADREGNMISLIQSVYHGWGSHIVPDRLGFPLQNRGKSFALDPNHYNKLEPHKRPFHTIIPGFVTKGGEPVFSFGVMGGDMQPQGQSQVLMNLIDFGLSPQQAGEQPRVQHFESSDPTGSKMSGGGSIGLENGFSDEVRAALADMGHKVRDGVGAFGGYQGVWREESPLRYYGGTDPRKDGCAVGY
jgi:gamma-glutamyltranspeptidase / glutathione hydrolase